MKKGNLIINAKEVGVRRGLNGGIAQRESTTKKREILVKIDATTPCLKKSRKKRFRERPRY